MAHPSGYNYRKPIAITAAAAIPDPYEVTDILVHNHSRNSADATNNALLFVAASSDYATVADRANLDITGAITLQAHIKPYTVSGTHMICLKGENVTTAYHYNYYFLITAGKLRFGWLDVGTPTTAHQQWTTDYAVIAPNTEYRVAVSMTMGTGASIKMYVNGTEQPGTWTVGNGNTAPTANAYTLKIGAAVEPGWTYLFDGILQALRISNIVRTTAEIWAWSRQENDFISDEDANVVCQIDCQGTTGGTTLLDTTGDGNGTLRNASIWSVGGGLYGSKHLFLDGKVKKKDFTDVCFTSSDATANARLWYDRVKNSIVPNCKCQFHVKVPAIANPGPTTIYAYCGNNNPDTSRESGLNTFIAYADIQNTAIDDTPAGFTVDHGTWAVEESGLFGGDYITSVKDVTIYKHDTNEYYLAFTDTHRPGNGWGCVSIAVSTNKQDWKYLRSLPMRVPATGLFLTAMWSPTFYEEAGTVYLFVCASTDAVVQNNMKIYYFTSTDCETWTGPTLLFGPAVWGMARGVLDPWITLDAGTYYLHYTLFTDDTLDNQIHEIGYATAATLTGVYTDQGQVTWSGGHLAWERAEAFPYYYCYSPCIIKRGADDYLMIYGAGDSNGNATYPGRVGYATATSMTGTWTKQGQITYSSFPSWLTTCITNPELHWIAADNEWELWFHGTDTVRNTAGYATSPNLTNGGTWTVQSAKALECQALTGTQGIIRNTTGTWEDVRLHMLVRSKSLVYKHSSPDYAIWRYAAANHACNLAGIDQSDNKLYIKKDDGDGTLDTVSSTLMAVCAGIADNEWVGLDLWHDEHPLTADIYGERVMSAVHTAAIDGAGSVGIEAGAHLCAVKEFWAAQYVAGGITWVEGALEGPFGAGDPLFFASNL
jgi:hypothetical protein